MQAIVARKSCRWGFFFTLQEISLTKAESCSAAVATAVEVLAPLLIRSDVVAAVAGAEHDCLLTFQAGRNGAQLIGFPEGFVPAHPVCYHHHSATGALSNRLATPS
jgi:hypothetical protein